MRIIDERMVFVSGPKRIHIVEYRDDSYRVVESFAVPAREQSMNDLLRVGEHYYVTATRDLMLRCRDLADLEAKTCDDVHGELGLKGNPYYFSRFDGRTYLGELAGRDAIVEFMENENGLALSRVLHAQ